MESGHFYLSNLTTYKYPPKNTSNLTELQSVCKSRLQLYCILIETERLNFEPHTNEWAKFIKEKIKQYSLQTYDILLGNDLIGDGVNARREDHLAHWILSLCYCKSEELQKFFIQRELEWFVLVYDSMSKKHIKDFLAKNRFEYEEIPSKEKEMFKEKLINCRSVINNDNFDAMVYNKTNFSNIINLINKREIFIYKGYAYFPDVDLIYLIKCKLHAQFKEQLEWNDKMSLNIRKEERIDHFLDSLPILKPRQLTFDSLNITLNDLEEISKHHYPLCMQNIHNSLKIFHHLKHECRIQYGVFLKYLGLPYDDAMTFFEQEFTKNVTKNCFNKQYSYYFKHYYGKVGGKINYKPYSCERIQSITPLPGQQHGCPFLHWDVNRLAQKFGKEGLHGSDIRDIEDLISDQRYSEACTLYYCSIKQVYRNTTIESPNQYCAESFVLEQNLHDLLKVVCETL